MERRVNLIVESLFGLGEFAWINRINAKKLGVITGSTIYYEDKVSGLSGTLTIELNDEISEFNIMVDSTIFEKWQKNPNWLGALDVYPEKPQQAAPTPGLPSVARSTTGTYTISGTSIPATLPAAVSAPSVPRISLTTSSVPAAPKPSIEKPDNILNLNIKLSTNLFGKIMISRNSANFLGITIPEQPIMFEDPLTGAFGGARTLISDTIPDDVIYMEDETYETSDIHSSKVIVFNPKAPKPSAAPIVKKDKLELTVEISSKGKGSTLFLSQRNCLSLDAKDGDILRFEDELTGAWGACRVRMDASLSDKVVRIEDEIFEATGIGASQVIVKHNDAPIIPLQSLTLGISPLTGENLWDVMSLVRDNEFALKDWLRQYLIFKGLKLRWKNANAAIKIIDSIPDLKGEILAEPKLTSSLSLRPEGLVTFNAVLIIDISSSMLARDMEVINIAPAIEGIRSAMDNERIRRFLSFFKEGIMVSRRLGAAFAALLFLAEKVGRGFGEKVSIIRFADIAEFLDFDGIYFDSASGKHGILEMAANRIVEKIGEESGTSTNMGEAIGGAHYMYRHFKEIEGEESSKPCMLVLLTDGYPTDGDNFRNAVESYFMNNPDVVFYIVGLGNPDRKLMKEIATRCGGEYFEPEDMGSLLIWYSKRARDLVVKLRGGRK
ncbi:MAG: VWA domain-containing protein [Candidatus Helarchaeota archaeon]|nr:VWA domain-containing protein [Candidatus Helarchaeota archaeon]